MAEHYILEGHEVVPADLMTWAKWYETVDSRHVARETVEGADISTVFLGLNHQYGDGPPMLFETLVFGGPLDQEMDRCSTWAEAEEMHRAMCERVRSNAPELSRATLAQDKTDAA